MYLKRAGERASARVIAACGEPWNQGFVAVHTLSNAFYLIERQRTRAEAWEFIRDVLAWATVAEIGTADVARTQQMAMSDFEDALQIVAAEGCAAGGDRDAQHPGLHRQDGGARGSAGGFCGSAAGGRKRDALTGVNCFPLLPKVQLRHVFGTRENQNWTCPRTVALSST